MSATLSPAYRLVERFLRDMVRAPKRRTMREFAEQEIVVPTGKYAGSRLDCKRQPFFGLLFDEIDSGRWQRFLVAGPSQSGKTLGAFVVPILYHLFEHGEVVCCGIPDGNMASDKWKDDILPVILKTRYAELLPRKGPGSRGGDVKDRVDFENGATLRFMTGGTGDKGVAGFTTRVLVVTELEAFARAGNESNEGDKLGQLKARTKSFDKDARIYLECTVTTTEGRTWYEYQQGTESRIAMPCQLCGEYVTLSRKCLNGWQGAKDEIDARENSAFYCPACNSPWTQEQHETAARQSVLVHAGQEIDKAGRITGEHKRTLQLGFRWSGGDNLLRTAGQLGYEEWEALQKENRDLAEREVSQFNWAEPTKPDKEDVLAISRQAIQRRIGTHVKGDLPADVYALVSFLDTGFRLCHWGVVAFDSHASPYVIDYGEIEVQQGVSPERGVFGAIREYHAKTEAGFGVNALKPGIRGVDSGHGEMADTIYEACREFGMYPTKGFGSTQQIARFYNAPDKRKKNSDILLIGTEYHVVRHRKHGKPVGMLIHFNADHWKSYAHARWITPMGDPGAACLFQAPEAEHTRFADHQVAERQYTEFIQGKGHVTKWEQIRPHNHYLDVFADCCMLGHLAGARLIGEVKPEKTSAAHQYQQREAKQKANGWTIGR